MAKNISTMTDYELREAHKKIMDDIYMAVGSVHGVVTPGQNKRRETIEAEMISRGMMKPEDE